MEILHLANCNQVIGKPSDMTDDQCTALPVQVFQDEQQALWARSFWMPTQEELAILNQGGCIALDVRASGRQHPVVALGAAPIIPPG